MTTESTSTDDATRRDGSPLTEGLGLAPERARVCPLQECRGRPRCGQCKMLDEMYPPQRNLSGRGDAPAVAASPEERALAADVFEALDLSPEQFLTEGGLVNRGKLRAAIWYPHDYLPEGHWMRASDPRIRPAAETRAWLVEWRFNGVQWLYLWPRAPCGFSFTNDAGKALRFARREDAEAALQWARDIDAARRPIGSLSRYGLSLGEMLATEHEWPNAEAERLDQAAKEP